MVYPDGSKSTRDHRSTQNKTPARYILTPTPSPNKQQKTTNDNELLISLRALTLFTICPLF